MFRTVVNIFRIPELRRKCLFTIGLLAIYRMGYHVPLPGMNQDLMAETLKKQSTDQGAFGQLATRLYPVHRR